MTEPSTLPARRLLLVHAHPDDESIGTGVTMAKYVAEGAAVTLVTCTRGEEGEVLVPSLSHLAAHHDDELGPHRVVELAEAMAVLGVSDHRFLGGAGRWRDSGMMGTPSNDRDDVFWRADLLEASAELAAVIRETRPQVLVTYDTFGGYGHPDHIQAHRVAMYGALLAGAPGFRPELGAPWSIAKVYWMALPREVLRRGMETLISAGGTGFFGTDDVDDIPFLTDDALVTTRILAPELEPLKMAALRKHSSQVETDSVFFQMADLIGPEAMGTEWFMLVRGRRGSSSVGEGGWEDDLFDGIEP
jgi:N-acetyl-1-D-myo-inositol-2-amino-2-deoxy-alpha-D-glucopyranoside deacetylase